MKTFFKGLITPIVATLVSFLPSVIHAQPLVPGVDIRDIDDIVGRSQDSILCRVFGWIFWLLIIVAVIFVVFAAFRYLTAGGEPEKIKKANYSLIYAVVAIVIALLARALPGIIFTFLGGSSGQEFVC